MSHDDPAAALARLRALSQNFRRAYLTYEQLTEVCARQSAVYLRLAAPAVAIAHAEVVALEGARRAVSPAWPRLGLRARAALGRARPRSRCAHGARRLAARRLGRAPSRDGVGDRVDRARATERSRARVRPD